jgi:hypothetical protein
MEIITSSHRRVTVDWRPRFLEVPQSPTSTQVQCLGNRQQMITGWFAPSGQSASQHFSYEWCSCRQFGTWHKRSNKKDSRAWFVHCLRGAKPPSLLHTHSENNSSQLHTSGCACLLERGFGTSTLKAAVMKSMYWRIL